MSTCISRHGEYSEHVFVEHDFSEFVCDRCLAFDEEQAEAVIRRLRTQLGCVKALATLWEESAAQIDRYVLFTPGISPSEKLRLPAKADASRSHAAALREMLAD